VPSDPYTLRREAERVIGEDRVPAEELERLLAAYGDSPQEPSGGAAAPQGLARSESLGSPRGRTRFFTVRLGINRPDYSAVLTRRDVRGEDADQAVAKAVKASERETGRSGWLLDGCEEQEG
jgi:hypothetical protein